MNVSEKLRLVQGLHSHAEMFGFNWNDDSDWTWHDVACKIADEIDVENEQLQTENDKLRELVKSMYHDLTHVTFPRRWLVDYEADMRELGMEVDE